jgi:hypothetical protein
MFFCRSELNDIPRNTRYAKLFQGHLIVVDAQWNLARIVC